MVLSNNTEAATSELMFLHVELAAEKVIPMPSARLSALAALAAEHAALPRPEQAGRRIIMPTSVR
jgi:hypothetical protein